MGDVPTLKMLKAIVLKLLPYLLSAFCLKLIIWMLESTEWWPKFNNPGIIMGVIGFGIAILLGAKLSVVNNRLYSIEDAVCRIVGALRIFAHKEGIGDDISEWAHKLEKTLVNPDKNDVAAMRNQTELLIENLVSRGHDGPNLAGFRRDVSYVLHRSTAEIPIAYEYFLTMTTILYTIMVCFVISGLGGFAAIFVVVFVLMGASVLTEDMDHPLDNSAGSLIMVNLEPLRHFTAQHSLERPTVK